MTKWQRISKQLKLSKQGVALFMVMSAVGILGFLASEVIFVSRLNHKMAFDSMDEVRARYLAKSAFKLALMRIKIYSDIKTALNKKGVGKQIKKVAEPLLDQFLQAKIPGISEFYDPKLVDTLIESAPLSKEQKTATKDLIAQVDLPGGFQSSIIQQSIKTNLNSFDPDLGVPPLITKKRPNDCKTTENEDKDGDCWKKTDSPPDPDDEKATARRWPVDKETASKALRKGIEDLFRNRAENDEEFASQYRDFEVDRFVESILAWADRKFEPRLNVERDEIPRKEAPFYVVSELRMLPQVDDEIYRMVSEKFTVLKPAGYNINAYKTNVTVMNAVLFGGELEEEEMDRFAFKMGDPPPEGADPREIKGYYQDAVHGPFEDIDNDFKEWATQHFEIFFGKKTFDDWKTELENNLIVLVTEESVFKIEVSARVNQTLQAVEGLVELPQPQSEPNPNEKKNSKKPKEQVDSINVTKVRFL